MYLDEIIMAISHMSRDNLRRVRAATKSRSHELNRIATYSIRVGERVSWTHRGRSYTGTVSKVNITTVNVKADNGERWKITSACLTKVAPKVDPVTNKQEELMF